MDKPIPEAVVRDPHHGGCNKWKWENGVLYHQSVGSPKWIKTRNVHPTPARIKALAAALTAAQQPDHIVDATKMVAQQQGQAVVWTEASLRDEATRRGWYVREGTSVPTVDGDWRHPFSVTAKSRELLDLLNAQPMQQGGGDATFAAWLATEMPAGTVISDPAWWANRISRQYAKRCAPPSAPVGVEFRDDIRRAIQRAKVFDDGSDGADAESAKSVVAILEHVLAMQAGERVMPHVECSFGGCRDKADRGTFTECEPYQCKLAKNALAQQPAAVDEVCAWSLDTIDESWDGSCGAKWQFTNGGPDDNDMRHCPQCGKRVATQHQAPTREGCHLGGAG